jgi:hypothetical protein
MGYPTTVQAIERKKAKQAQWYVNFPNALAQAMDFSKGEIVEWDVESTTVIRLTRVAYRDKIRRKRRTK